MPIADDLVLIRRPGARLLLGAIELVERTQRRDGIAPPPSWRQLKSALASIQPPSGQPDVRSDDSTRRWAPDEIGTEEAATMLDISQRHANRLARAGALGLTRKVGNRRLVSRTEVEAYQSMRPGTEP